VFQSRSGFSVRRDEIDRLHTLWYSVVSIPVWVFSPSRPVSATTDNSRRLLFQSRSGFSVRRDGRCFRRHESGHLPVSIPVWVFSPSRHLEGEAADGNGVFQSRSGFSVRRDSPLGQDLLLVGALFQSRSGFSVRRDRRVLSGRTPRPSFNPGLGFQSVATRTTTRWRGRPRLFQSRSGFSVRRD